MFTCQLEGYSVFVTASLISNVTSELGPISQKGRLPQTKVWLLTNPRNIHGILSERLIVEYFTFNAAVAFFKQG
jgi:hypothetical protein